jgi:hypothetical protein
MAKYYTGVGSRDIPPWAYFELKAIAKRLSLDGYVVRSGGADGADTAFYQGGYPNTEIYLPWDGFNNMTAGHEHVNAKSLDNHTEACKIAASFHPAWDKLSNGAKLLHARNAYQVLGFNLDDPSLVLICYAPPKGMGVKGGTSTAFEIAKSWRVPTYNIYLPNELRDIKSILNIQE